MLITLITHHIIIYVSCSVKKMSSSRYFLEAEEDQEVKKGHKKHEKDEEEASGVNSKKEKMSEGHLQVEEINMTKAIKKRNSKKRKKDEEDKFPGPAPLDPAAAERHSRGEGVKTERVRNKYHRKMQERREKRRKMAEEMAARAEILVDNDEEEGGFIEGDDVHEFTGQVS